MISTRMGSVRTAGAGAWVLLGPYFRGNLPIYWCCYTQHGLPPASRGAVDKESPDMADLGYVVLTLAVFGVLLLILKGIERFER
jgi:hypothetical protein